MHAGVACCGDPFVIGLRLSGGVEAEEAQPRLDADAARAILLHSRSGRTRRAVCGTRAFSPEWRAADCALFLHYRLFEAGPLFFADDIRGYGLHLRALLAARAVASLPVRLHRPLRQVAADGGGKRADFK
jgi:hypothetical protein